ncbi:MAG: glycosyltransferase [Microbacteriaceae bacterium]
MIAAHNEESVIGACLRALYRADPAAQVIVSANGCSDRTAAIATDAGVLVVDRAEPGKAGALNAAEVIASVFPRIYLDADIVVPPDGISGITEAFGPGILAVVPRRRIDTQGRPWPVRGYFAINERLPAFRRGLFGRGMIAVSEEGRARFDSFPDMVADDLFLDSQFGDDEKAIAHGVEVVIAAPHTTGDLIRRLVRVRRGNAEMRAAAARGELPISVRQADRWAWLRDVVIPNPSLALAAVPFLAITVIAARRARRAPAPGAEWGRDESTRESTRA